MSGPPEQTLRLTGIPASAGYAEGPVFWLEAASSSYLSKGSVDLEAEALQAAIDAASGHLAALIADAVGDAADMLEFQLAMLSDDALSLHAFAAIRGGAPADRAWDEALSGEIAGYESSSDDYFRARAADLKDIRQQVLDALTATIGMDVPSGSILFADDIAPTRFLATDWSKGGGLALARGSAASHVAMLARSRGVPMVVGIGGCPAEAAGIALLDAEHGGIVLRPTTSEIDAFRQSSAAFELRRKVAEEGVSRPAVTANDLRIEVMVNIADPADVERLDVGNCDGVGLMRTEFLFGSTLPDEDSQYRAYRRVLEWAGGKPVTIRTVDAGGDKPVPGFTVEEGNPFLGMRGIRLALARPDVFRIQIRALLRAAVHGNLKVMFPMVAIPQEYGQARALFVEESGWLTQSGIPHAMPPLGIMVEVPSVAISPELFAEAAFFSIGSNDLTQYVMAAARDNVSVAALNSIQNPAVLRLIREVAMFGSDRGIPVSLCGDAGGDPAAIPALLHAGLRQLSVAPAQLALAKAAIAAVVA